MSILNTEYIPAAPLDQLSEHLYSMKEILGSIPQIDTMEIHFTECARLEFFRSILQYEYLASHEVQKTVLKFKHMIDMVSQYRLTQLGKYISANLTIKVHHNSPMSVPL